jgi:large subunit ribosomal protein L12
MEYIYAALLLHSAKQEISEEKLLAVVKGAGLPADAAKAKSVVAALQGVNIAEVLKNAAAAPVAVAAAAPAAEAKKEPKEEKKSEEEAAAGLAGLFG